ncbi:MAG TPA: hypothetical protein ENJ09_05690 [Planctomycetes bacterium]|nr:hypothetical protein [Planctomycetota bacterium]
MRRPLYAIRFQLWAAFAALVASTGSACVSAPTPAEVLATGFHSPEQALETFQTALRADLVDLEYRCLSTEFKESHGGFSWLAYDEARRRVLEEEPFFKLVARATVEKRTQLAPNRVRLECRVRFLFQTKSFTIDFVREDAYLVRDAEGPLEGDLLSFEDAVREEDGRLVVRVPFPEGVELEELTGLEIAREWKIAAFAEATLPPVP